VSPPRCPHCGAAADPVGEMIAAIKAGKVALLSPEQITATLHAAAETPEQAERLQRALDEHEARKDP
jgi:hypothetical protein